MVKERKLFANIALFYKNPSYWLSEDLKLSMAKNAQKVGLPGETPCKVDCDRHPILELLIFPIEILHFLADEKVVFGQKPFPWNWLQN